MTDLQKVGDFKEDSLIQTYIAPIAQDLSDDVAALKPASDQELLVSTDMLNEGIHFLRQNPPAFVGQKALRVNVSDIVASGGKPRWFTLSLGLPRDLPLAWLKDFVCGLKQAMDDTQVQLCGGDTTATLSHIQISITAFGTVPIGQRIGRDGARPGDWLGVTGPLGGAGLGLEVMFGKFAQLPFGQKQRLLKRHFQPPFRASFGCSLAKVGLVHAMMDLSDGLACDLGRLCKASGVGAEIELCRVPLTEDGQAVALEPQAAALYGEDYELLFAASPQNWPQVEAIGEECGTSVFRVGAILEKPSVIWRCQGKQVYLPSPTWQHFS